MCRVYSIIPAGGEGSRFGGTTPKQLVEIGGRSILDWSIRRLLEVSTQAVVALPQDLVESPPSVFQDDSRVAWVAGGPRRWLSVHAAFAELRAEPDDLVAVHDAARPAVSPLDLGTVVEAARAVGAAVLGRPVSDTLKRVEHGRVVGTVDRTLLFRAETPQVFSYSLLERGFVAAQKHGGEYTDEAAIVELLDNVEIAAIPARHPNPKVTTPSDLEWIRTLLEGAS